MQCLCLLLVILVIYWYNNIEGFDPLSNIDYFYYDNNDGLFHKGKISNKDNKMIVISDSLLSSALNIVIGDLDKDSSLKLKNIFDPSHSDNNVANLGEGFY